MLKIAGGVFKTKKGRRERPPESGVSRGCPPGYGGVTDAGSQGTTCSRLAAVMEALGAFLSLSQGRDRLLRATQYACSLSAHSLREHPESRDVVDKLRSLEANVSAGRKLFRLGNTINSIEAAKRTMKLSDRVLCLSLTVAHINRALYFICDNVLWARNVCLVRGIDKERWSTTATRCYLLSLVMNLTRDAYVIGRLMAQRAGDRRFRQEAESHLGESADVAEVVCPPLDVFLFLLLDSLKSHPAVALDTVKNICDLFQPLDRLGIYESNPGVVGFCGLLSSLLGILTLVRPKLKLKP